MAGANWLLLSLPKQGLVPICKAGLCHMDTPHLVQAVNLCDLTMIKAKVSLAQVKELLLPRTLHFRHYSRD